MATERTVRREVTEERVEPAARDMGGREVRQAQTEQVEQVETREVREVSEVQPAPRGTESQATNVNVTADADASGNVSINTPDGTQVNVNT